MIKQQNPQFSPSFSFSVAGIGLEPMSVSRRIEPDASEIKKRLVKPSFSFSVAGIGLEPMSVSRRIEPDVLKIKKLGKTKLFFSSCGDWTRTNDLRVMSPTSYQLLHPAICVRRYCIYWDKQ